MSGCPKKMGWMTALLWLVRLCAEEEIYGEFRQDLEEGYSIIRTEKGRFTAGFWWWLRVIESIPIFILMQFQWSMEMMNQFIRIALRTLKRQKMHSAVSLVSFAIGLGCSILILMYVGHEFQYDRFHAHGDRIYRIFYEDTLNSRHESQFSHTVSGAISPLIDKEFPEVECSCRVWEIFSSEMLMVFEDKSYTENKIFFTDATFLRMFDFELVEGDLNTVLAGPFEMVITKQIKEKYFGDEAALGRSIQIDHKHAYTVVGVVDNPTGPTDLNFEILLSGKSIGEHWPWGLEEWATKSCDVYVELSDFGDADELIAKMPGFFNRHHRLGESERYGLQPLYDIHLYSTHMGNHAGDIRQVRLLSGIAILILLIAAINYVNLATAQGTVRSTEISMRKVMGASQSNLIFLFLGESIMLAAVASLLAFGLVSLALPGFNYMIQRDLSFTVLGTPQLIGGWWPLWWGLGSSPDFIPPFISLGFHRCRC